MAAAMSEDAVTVAPVLESLKLWVALTQEQLDALKRGEEAHPDTFTNRFGLRVDPVEAAERAHYHMNRTEGKICLERLCSRRGGVHCHWLPSQN
eukprot:s3181_g5.t1